MERGASDNDGAGVDDFVGIVVDLLTIPIERTRRAERREEVRRLPRNCPFARIIGIGDLVRGPDARDEPVSGHALKDDLTESCFLLGRHELLARGYATPLPDQG